MKAHGGLGQTMTSGRFSPVAGRCLAEILGPVCTGILRTGSIDGRILHGQHPQVAQRCRLKAALHQKCQPAQARHTETRSLRLFSRRRRQARSENGSACGDTKKDQMCRSHMIGTCRNRWCPVFSCYEAGGSHLPAAWPGRHEIYCCDAKPKNTARAEGNGRDGER